MSKFSDKTNFWVTEHREDYLEPDLQNTVYGDEIQSAVPRLSDETHLCLIYHIAS